MTLRPFSDAGDEVRARPIGVVPALLAALDCTK